MKRDDLSLTAGTTCDCLPLRHGGYVRVENEERPLKIVYLVSPLGFSPEWKSYKNKIKGQLLYLGRTSLAMFP